MDSNVRNSKWALVADSILEEVFAERLRQVNKWGQQLHKPETWLSILGEEYGEACKANNEKDGDEYRKELLETAAVAVAAVEAYDAGIWERSTANAAVSS